MKRKRTGSLRAPSSSGGELLEEREGESENKSSDEDEKSLSPPLSRGKSGTLELKEMVEAAPMLRKSFLDDKGDIPNSFFSPVGAKGVENVKALSQRLQEVPRHVIDKDIPPEHKLSHRCLNRILRGTKWFNYASAYEEENDCMVINVPLRWKSKFIEQDKATMDRFYIELTHGWPMKASYWAPSPGKRNSMKPDKFYEWIIRHEYGHSIDKLIQFTNRFSGNPQFGGWVRYQSAEFLLIDMLWDMGVIQNAQDWAEIQQHRSFKAICKTLKPAAGSWCPTKNWAWHRRPKGRLWKIQHEDKNTQRAFRKVCFVIDCAINDPWLEGGVIRDNRLSGRRYHRNTKGDEREWYSYLDGAFGKRISNYQMSAPSEWFAETYAAFVGAGTKFQQLLRDRDPDTDQWFTNNLLSGGPNDVGLIDNNRQDNAMLIPYYPQYNELETDVPGSWHIDNNFNRDAKKTSDLRRELMPAMGEQKGSKDDEKSES
jgi:hypothetical protein